MLVLNLNNKLNTNDDKPVVARYQLYIIIIIIIMNILHSSVELQSGDELCTAILVTDIIESQVASGAPQKISNNEVEREI